MDVSEGKGDLKDAAILVVDDEPFIRKIVTGLLEAAGHRPMAVGDSQKALELFAAGSFDAVITDYNMPVMTGVDLARRMRTLKPSIPVCLVTGNSEELDPSEMECFAGVLEKPFEPVELANLLTAVLPKSHRAAGLVTRPPRYEVDWRVDCIPLEAGSLMRRELVQHPAALRNISEHGLAFVAEEAPVGDRFCAFLIYPPATSTPSLMVGEVRWTRDRNGKKVAGTKSLFWGSEREKSLAIEQAM